MGSAQVKRKYLWVIGGGQLQIPLIAEATNMGLKTIVSDLNPHCAAREHADIFLEMDIFDIDAHLDYLKTHSSLEVAGVLAAGIDAPETMAAMNEYLGLKGVSLSVAEVTKNKHLFREKLKKLGYPVPGYVVIDTRDNTKADRLDKLLSGLDFPLIVKPVNNSGSRDMRIFSCLDESMKAFIQEKFDKYNLILVEEVWIGKEQTVECLIDINGQFHQGFITDRHFTFADGYPVETGLVHPTELDSDTQKQLYQLARDLAGDLGISVGAVKLDTIVTDQGPRVIELTVRHSGGFDCQYLVPRSTGKNILKAAILTAIQEPFDPEYLQDKLGRYGMTASVWPKPGVVTQIEGVDEAKGLDGVEEVFIRYDIGDRVEPYVDCAKRVAFIIATGSSRKSVRDTITKAINLIHIETI